MTDRDLFGNPIRAERKPMPGATYRAAVWAYLEDCGQEGGTVRDFLNQFDTRAGTPTDHSAVSATFVGLAQSGYIRKTGGMRNGNAIHVVVER